MTVILVVEGMTDQLILERLWPVLDTDQTAKFVPGGGLSNAMSLARSLLVTHRVPVVLFLDADTVDKSQIQERQSSLKSYLGLARDAPSKVILASPSIESILFFEKAIIKRHLGEIDSSQLVEARYKPKKVLSEVLPRSSSYTEQVEHLMGELSEQELQQLAKAPPLVELQQFLTEIEPGERLAHAQ